MKGFKNRTIALILASTVVVAGAFGTENYINSIKSIEFKSSDNGNVSMMMYTKTNFTGNLTPIKRDASTYVIMLPNINSEMVNPPKLSASVQNIDIKTMPYTPSGKGYTKITIKTSPNINLNIQPAIYIEAQKPASELEDSQKKDNNNSSQNNFELIKNPDPPVTNIENNTTSVQTDKTKQPSFNTQNNNSYNNSIQDRPDKDNTSDYSNKIVNSKGNQAPPSDYSDLILLAAGLLVVIALMVFLFLRGKAQMKEMLGDQPEINLNDEEDKKDKKIKKTKNNKSNIKNTINDLDRMYTNNYPIPSSDNKQNETLDITQTESQDNHNLENTTEDTFFDLDELFQEEKSQETESLIDEDIEENSALDDFLNSFEFDDGESERQKEVELVNLINTELYDKFINNDNLRFSKDDIQKIEKLLNSEISEEAKNSLMTVPVTSVKPLSKQERLEDIITTLSIDRQIKFSDKDVASIKKLMNVELDNNFVTDLRTNPDRTKTVEKELRNKVYGPSHNVSEIITLQVRDMLPNLSDELKKWDGKEIQQEKKSNVVMYSEGFEVSTLSVSNELPDIEKEKDKIDKNQYRPSDDGEIALSGYNVSTLEVSKILPDLKDAAAHPEKYADKPKRKEIVDEDALLQSISHVSFKPFYDDSQKVEITNNFDNKEEEDNKSQTPANNAIENTDNSAGQEDAQICSIDNQTFNIISKSEFDNNSGCYLAQNGDIYVVVGYIGDNTYKIKTYENLRTKKICSRINETLKDGSKQYLVKIGLNKFILNVTDTSMDLVIDLC